MSGIQPVAVYMMKVPAGDVMVPACPDFAAMFRVSMAAIDPSAEPEFVDGKEEKTPRATLKMMRVPNELFDDDDSDSDESDLELDEDDDISDEDANGGPSDPAKSKKASQLNIAELIAGGEDSASEDDENNTDDDAKTAKAAIMRAIKGKNKANGDDDDDSLGDLSFDGDDADSSDWEEVVICTLDPEKHYQQTLDIVVGENEKVYFKVSGTHEVHLTGNYVIPVDDGQAQLYSDDEEDVDLSPDEDELEAQLALEAMEDDESDELDDMDDPRIMEVDSDEEAPKLTAPAAKGKNKRPAEDSDEGEANLDDIMAKSIKAAEPTTNGAEKPLSKSQKKKLKKQKKNDGQAAAVEPTTDKDEKAAKKVTTTNGEKKVQFAKNLEQGPSSTSSTKNQKKDDTKQNGARPVKTLSGGVTIVDHKTGSGKQAAKGSHVEMRYIGKLEDGKVFDANKKGKAFSFKLGANEVIKGWEIGIAGMAPGGERRLTVPAAMGYGSKGAPPNIPPNSTLIFDVKALNVK